MTRARAWMRWLGSLAAAAPLAAAAAQQSPRAPSDSLRLGALHQQAIAADPRRAQLDLYARQTDLRLRTIAAERLPSFAGEGQAQYQSDVVHIPIELPSGQRIPSPTRDTYDVHVGVEESLFDPSRAPRAAVERARLATSRAAVRSTLYNLRQEVNASFFAAAALQERGAQLATTIAGLEARLKEVAVRVREGAALPSDTAAIQATLLERRQDEAQVAADRRAAVARLSDLIGRPIADSARVALPALDAAVARARAALDTLRARPEYAQFARAREELARQADVASARAEPRVSAFARVGYGRPGLNLLSDQFDGYWLAGVRVQWAPWNWGSTARERDALAVQRQIVATNEAAFTDALRRAVQADLATIDRVEHTLAADDTIIALRERIEREARLQLQEGVLTAAAYLDRNTDLLTARLTRAAHRVELARAQAEFLTTMGVEVP